MFNVEPAPLTFTSPVAPAVMPRWLLPVVLATPPLRTSSKPLPEFPMKNEPEAFQVEPGSLTVIVPVENASAPAKPRTLRERAAAADFERARAVVADGDLVGVGPRRAGALHQHRADRAAISRDCAEAVRDRAAGLDDHPPGGGIADRERAKRGCEGRRTEAAGDGKPGDGRRTIVDLDRAGIEDL